MAGAIPIMCAAALSVLYAGEVTSTDQLQTGYAFTFPNELPNDKFTLKPTHEMWQTSVKLQQVGQERAPSGMMFFTEVGPARWKHGQRITVVIHACNDEGMLSTLQTWNALAPGYRSARTTQ